MSLTAPLAQNEGGRPDHGGNDQEGVSGTRSGGRATVREQDHLLGSALSALLQEFQGEVQRPNGVRQGADGNRIDASGGILRQRVEGDASAGL